MSQKNLTFKQPEVSEYTERVDAFLKECNVMVKPEYVKFGRHFEKDAHDRNIFKVTVVRDFNTKNEKSFIVDFGASIADSWLDPDRISVIANGTFDFFFGLKYEGLRNNYLRYSKTFKVADLKKAWQGTRKDVVALLSVKELKDIYAKFIESNSSKYNKVVNVQPEYVFIEMVENKLMQECGKLAKMGFGEGEQNPEVVLPSNYDIMSCLTKYDPYTFEDFCGNYGYDTDSISALKTYEAVKKEWADMSNMFTPEELEQLNEIAQ